MSTTIFKYFVDENGKIHNTGEEYFGCYLSINSNLSEVAVVASEDDEILGEFTLWNSLLELENIGVNTTPYRLNRFLTELANLNEKSVTIGTGKLADIKEQAQYFLDKLNKE